MSGRQFELKRNRANDGLEPNENDDEDSSFTNTRGGTKDDKKRQQGDAPSIWTNYLDWIKNNKKIIIFLLLGLLLAGIIIIIVTFSILSSKDDSEEQTEKVSCTGNNFKELQYIAPSHAESATNQRFLKYKLITTLQGQPMNFTNVLKKCKELGASLWQVLDGDTEWNALLGKLKEENVIDVWLHGEVVGSCPGLSYQCQKDEAVQGFGLAVRWPSSYTASYTRLYVGASTEKNCIVVENKEPYLWTTDYCSEKEHPGICVKRNCIQE